MRSWLFIRLACALAADAVRARRLAPKNGHNDADIGGVRRISPPTFCRDVGCDVERLLLLSRPQAGAVEDWRLYVSHEVRPTGGRYSLTWGWTRRIRTASARRGLLVLAHRQRHEDGEDNGQPE